MAPPAGFVVDGERMSTEEWETWHQLRRGAARGEELQTIAERLQRADFFEIFGMRPHYRIDPVELDHRYLAISRQNHPDRFATAGPASQSAALSISAVVNKAYDVLRDDYRRAEYLLELAGGPSAAEERQVPGNLLAEVMMLREEIDEAATAKDRHTLERIREALSKRRALVAGEVTAMAEDIGHGGQNKEMRQQLNALKYLNNLMEQVPHLQ